MGRWGLPRVLVGNAAVRTARLSIELRILIKAGGARPEPAPSCPVRVARTGVLAGRTQAELEAGNNAASSKASGRFVQEVRVDAACFPKQTNYVAAAVRN